MRLTEARCVVCGEEFMQYNWRVCPDCLNTEKDEEQFQYLCTICGEETWGEVYCPECGGRIGAFDQKDAHQHRALTTMQRRKRALGLY